MRGRMSERIACSSSSQTPLKPLDSGALHELVGRHQKATGQALVLRARVEVLELRGRERARPRMVRSQQRSRAHTGKQQARLLERPPSSAVPRRLSDRRGYKSTKSDTKSLRK